jgi:peptidoglycan/LPS O-acetylase OafA/YrhL
MVLRIRYLDGLRGLAIAGVVLYHAFAVPLTRYGAMGVELFFMISGFVILMTLEQCTSFEQFFARRWMRLYPAMLIACAVTLIVFGLGRTWPEGSNVFPGLTLIDDRWYSWAFDRNVKSLDGAYWTLYLEMRFYVIFGLAYFLLGTRSAIILLIAMSLAYLVLLSTGHGMGIWRWTDFRFEAWFAAGALFYLWTKDQRETLFIAAVSAGLLAAWIYYPGFGPRMVGVGLVTLFAAGVRYPLAQSALSLKPITFVGFVSYPLYLVHSRIIEYAGWPGIFISLGLAYLIAAYSEKWVRNRLIVHMHVRQRA